MNEAIKPQTQYEARFYNELHETNPHLPAPEYVTHGFQIDTAEGGIPVIKIAVYIKIPDAWLAPEPVEVPSE